MVYIVTIAFLLVFIFVFDIGKGKKADANTCYNLTLLWFIAVSGFAYNVGSDTVIYMEEYSYANWKSLETIEAGASRQPAWLLLEFLCRRISDNFVLFKLVIAAFGNWAVFRFIKKHSSFPFISVLFYGLFFALHLNFNALRQFVAVGFFLIGYDYLIDKKWIKYYLLVVIAYLFHSTALICAFFPLLMFLKLNKRSIGFLGAIVLVGTSVLLSMDLSSVIAELIFSNEDLISEEMMSRGEVYFGDNSLGSVSWSIFGMIRIIFFVGLYLWILFFNLSNERARKLDHSLYVLFVLFYVLNFCVPIVFFRFLFYLQPFFICLLPNAVVKFADSLRNIKTVAVAVMIMFFSIEPIINLSTVSSKTGVPLIVQYYPYYSVFNPQIDPVRSSAFGAYRK